MNTQLEDWDRLIQWNRIIPGYIGMCRTNKKNAKRKWREMNSLNDIECRSECLNNKTSATAATSVINWGWCAELPKKESAMYNAPNVNLNVNNTADQSAEQKRSYLYRRLWNIADQKKDDAKRSFGLLNDKAPATPTEIVERIKTGQFVLPTEWREDWEDYYDAVSSIEWRNPKIKKDKEGYKTWIKEIYDPARKRLEDSIVIDPPETALANLQAWESAA